MHSSQPWTLTDGHAGNRRQADALAHALGLQAMDWTLPSRLPWRLLAPRRMIGAERAFGRDFQSALGHPPSLAIGCGRQAALATRLLRERGSRVVQILDPRIDPAHWDLVVVPEHDGLSGDNVISLVGSLNPVDDAWLARARADFARFQDLRGPRTALLLGGASAHAAFTVADFEALATQLDAALSADPGSLLVTASRRTPADVVAAVRQRYTREGNVVWCHAGDGDNPYAGLLAWADRIVCTPDSVNMVSEACATRVPVFVFEPQRVQGRPMRFLQSLLERGRLRTLEAGMQAYPVEPLRETTRVATLVRQRLGL